MNYEQENKIKKKQKKENGSHTSEEPTALLHIFGEDCPYGVRVSQSLQEGQQGRERRSGERGGRVKRYTFIKINNYPKDLVWGVVDSC